MPPIDQKLDDVRAQLVDLPRQQRVVVAFHAQPFRHAHVGELVVAPVPAQCPVDVGLVAVGDARVTEAGGQHAHVVAALAQVPDGGSPDLLVPAEVVGGIHVPRGQDPHGASIGVATLAPVSTDGPDVARGATVVVAIVSWNTRDLLDRCLRSLEGHATDGTAEIWVVDNGSSDGSVEMVRERHGWAQLVESGENLGYGRAVNLVADRTSSPWFALSNADIALRPGALEALLEAGEADPGAGVVAPRLILPDGRTQHSAWAFPTVASTVVQNAGALVVGARLADRLALQGAWNPERARRVPWAVGAFLLVRREAWDAVGGFDAGQWMSAEDLDLGWRMRAAGWATRYEPRAVVDHEESAATRQVWGSDLAIHWQRCAYAWMLRRLGRAAYRRRRDPELPRRRRPLPPPAHARGRPGP